MATVANMQMQAPSKTAIGVEVEGVSKSYGTLDVFKNVSLSIQPGEIFALMGPSGTGKSVLLRSIIGLEKPDAGRILIGGKDAANPETHQAFVTAIVFQHGALFNSMSVFDNLALYPREHRLYSESELKGRVLRTLKSLNLEGVAEKFPAQMSGGMRKRIAIARALMMEPQLILYDEPTSELDPVTAAGIAEVIGTLREEFEVTSIIVTHDTQLARGIADRVALMDAGNIAALGNADALLEGDDPNCKLTNFIKPTINLQNPRFRATSA